MKRKTTRMAVKFIFILLIIILYFMIKTKIGNDVERTEVSLTNNWNITINGVSQEEHSLDKLFFPVTNAGNHVELVTSLPDTWIQRPMLQLKIYHSIVTVHIDGLELYSYGTKLYQAGNMVGSGYHWISLPEDFSGKELKICFDVTEDNAFSSIETIYLMEEKYATKNLVLKNITEVIVGIFLLSFGLLLTGVVLFLGKAGKEYRILLWIAIFSVTVALWMMGSTGILQLVCSNLNTLAYFEYLSLYLAPIPILLFVLDAFDNNRTKKVFPVFIGIVAVFNITVILLNQFGICHFSRVLTLFHGLGFCTIALTTGSILTTWKRQNKKSDHMILQGLGIMVIFLFADTLRFNIDKYIHPQNINLSSSILPIGVLIFVIAMIASYIYRLVQLFYESAEKQTLLQIAYTDQLTKVGNRAMCEKIFQEWDVKKPAATIINFDLNHFKEVNDRFGHGTGDTLLAEFAKILQDNYKKDGFIGRMGGDEFIVILKTNDSSYVEKTLAHLMKKIDKLNQKEGRLYQISTAYGYCTNAGNSGCSLWDMYEASDKKMYQNKEACR
ncbi:MAG: diguanylate cyclase [Lachnospiraceae bacterium]|nr:diguanylate cyclase [Lachnospiraceae bacterium]